MMSNAGSAYAISAQHPDNPGRQQTHVETIVTRLAELTGDARTIDAHLQNIYDRAFGPVPEKNESGVREAKTGAHGAMSDRVDDLAGALNRIRAKVEQLSSFV